MPDSPQPKPLAPHQVRLLEEHRQVDDRIGQLSDFIADSNIYRDMNTVDQQRLSIQLDFMRGYRKILRFRIDSF
jgi:hypothetical protein